MIVLNFIIVFIMLILIDIPMITFINKKMYQDAFYKINNNMNISTGTSGIIAGIICYLLLAFGVYYFIISPEINNFTQMTNQWIFGY